MGDTKARKDGFLGPKPERMLKSLVNRSAKFPVKINPETGDLEIKKNHERRNRRMRRDGGRVTIARPGEDPRRPTRRNTVEGRTGRAYHRVA